MCSTGCRPSKTLHLCYPLTDHSQNLLQTLSRIPLAAIHLLAAAKVIVIIVVILVVAVVFVVIVTVAVTR